MNTDQPPPLPDETIAAGFRFPVNYWPWMIALFWTLVVALSLGWDLSHIHTTIIDLARAEARSSFYNDLVYRQWAAGHGGVYVPTTEQTPPNPYLVHIPERDLVTPSGRRLTLVNPAYMTRQVHELTKTLYQGRGHITSLNPIRPQNAPDSWERLALEKFPQGLKEISSQDIIEGHNYLRIMRPIITEKGCLKCHAKQGYREGDIRGGISVAVLLAPYEAIGGAYRRAGLIAHGAIWLLGLSGLALGTQQVRRRRQERDRAEAELRERKKELEQEIQTRKETEIRIRKNEQILQTVFNGITDPLIMVDEEMRVIRLNRSAELYCGQTIEEMMGEGLCTETMKKNCHSCLGCNLPSAVAGGKQIVFERRGFAHPERVEQVTIYPLEKQEGAAGAAIIRFSDKTEAKVMEKQLLQSQKLASLGFLISGIAHEINNPNSFITFNLPILRDYLEEILPVVDDYAAHHPEYMISGLPYPDFRQDLLRLLENLDHGALRINTIVGSLKGFASSSDHVLVRTNIGEVIQKGITLCRSKVSRMVRTLEVDIPPDLPLLHTNPGAIEQVILNLLINAAQAADKKNSWIRLNVRKGNSWRDHLVIEVTDNGSGMDDRTIEKIFDPFFTTKAPGEGTGLGLSVSHTLIDALGGRIEVKSTKGKGSTFRVILSGPERRKRKRG